MPALQARHCGGQTRLTPDCLAVSRRIRITVSYDGTAYNGWQVQPGLPTIQRELERVLAEIESTPVRVIGSGRTDAGVHALGQVAAFTIENPIPSANLMKAMNRLLNQDVRVLAASEVHTDFHPRFDARAKTYEYRILRTELCLPFDRLYVHHHPYSLDETAMVDLAAIFEGEHDFTAFSATDEKDALGRSKVRKIFESRIERHADRLIYRVRGSGFLKHMVRNMVGVLLETGKGNLSRADLNARLTPGNHIPSGPTVPSCGLFLMSVDY